MAIYTRAEKARNPVHKFGRNRSVSSGATEDVWDGDTLYTWPTAAGRTFVISDITTDDGTGASLSGAHSVTIEGLDANYLPAKETVRLNGTATVVCTTSFLRTHRMYIDSAGGDGTNAGNISCYISSGGAQTLTAQIGSALGQTEMAIYTTDAACAQYETVITSWGGYLSGTGNIPGSNAIEIALKWRPLNGAWRTLSTGRVDANAQQFKVHFDQPIAIPQKADIRVSADTSADGADVAGFFDLHQRRVGQPTL